MSTGPARSTTTKRPTSVSGPPSARTSLSRSNSSLSTTGAAKSTTLRSTVPVKPVPPARKSTVANRTSSVPSSLRTDSPAPTPDDGPQINDVPVNGETFDTAKDEVCSALSSAVSIYVLTQAIHLLKLVARANSGLGWNYFLPHQGERQPSIYTRASRDASQ